MIFVHAGVETKVSEISEHRVNDEPLEGLRLPRESEKNSGIA